MTCQAARIRTYVFLCSLTLLATGCSYQVQPTAAPAMNVYSSYTDEIPGSWFLVMDDSLVNISREIKPSSYLCSAHKYPIAVGDALKSSISGTLDSVFENVMERSSMPSRDELMANNSNGTILVNLDAFDAALRCQPGFWSGSCTANADFKIGIIVNGLDGRLFGSSVGSTGIADGDAGMYCDGGSQVISDAITKAVRDSVERMGERLSNAPQLRSAKGMDGSLTESNSED